MDEREGRKRVLSQVLALGEYLHCSISQEEMPHTPVGTPHPTAHSQSTPPPRKVSMLK